MKKAFTLNELLIAIAIIGVILIIAIPIVYSHFNKKSQVVGLQRAYTAVTNAVKLMLIDERVKSISKSSLYVDAAEDTVENTAGKFLKKYFTVTRDCGTAPGDCFANSYSNLIKEPVALPDSGKSYCVKTSMGSSICIEPPDEAIAARVLVDVNGESRPNVAGRDLFLFYIYKDGFIGDRVSDASDVVVCRENAYGSGCFNRIINSDWSMDY